MKTEKELNALKAEVEIPNQKLSELTDKKLAEVAGGAWGTEKSPYNWQDSDGKTSKIVTDQDHIWLYEESYDQKQSTSTWYGSEPPAKNKLQ